MHECLCIVFTFKFEICIHADRMHISVAMYASALFGGLATTSVACRKACHRHTVTRHVDFPVDSGELVLLLGGILNPYPCEVCK